MTGLTALTAKQGAAFNVSTYMTFPGKCIIHYNSKKLKVGNMRY